MNFLAHRLLAFLLVVFQSKSVCDIRSLDVWFFCWPFITRVLRFLFGDVFGCIDPFFIFSVGVFSRYPQLGFGDFCHIWSLDFCVFAGVDILIDGSCDCWFGKIFQCLDSWFFVFFGRRIFAISGVWIFDLLSRLVFFFLWPFLTLFNAEGTSRVRVCLPLLV